MKSKNWLGCVAITALLSTAATVAQANELDQIKAAGVLKVATSLSVAPYTFTDASMKPDGSEVATAALLAKDLGVRLEIVGTTVAARIPTLISGKADIVMSVLAKSPEREKVIDFSIPYSLTETVLIAPTAAKIGGYDDLAGQTVGVTRGTVEDQVLTQGATKSTIRRYEDVPTLVTAVVSGQIKNSAGSLTMLTNINKSANNAFAKKFTMRQSEIGIGMRKNEPELRAWLDQWIKTNLKNGRLNTVYKKYHGVELSLSAANEK